MLVCLSVCPESVLWKNGWVDPDAVQGGEWGGSRHGCIRGGHVPQGDWGFGDFRFHWFQCRVFNRNVFNSSRAQVTPMDGFWQSIRHMTSLHAMVCLLKVLLVYLPIYLKGKIPTNCNFGGVNRYFQAKRAKYSNVHIIETIAWIPISNQDGVWCTSWNLQYLVHEKFTIFPYGQYIVGIDGSLAFCRYSQVRAWWWGLRQICENIRASSQWRRNSNVRKQLPYPRAAVCER